MIELIRRCYKENPLNLPTLSGYGAITTFRKAIPVLLGRIKSAKKQSKGMFEGMYG